MFFEWFPVQFDKNNFTDKPPADNTTCNFSLTKHKTQKWQFKKACNNNKISSNNKA